MIGFSISISIPDTPYSSQGQDLSIRRNENSPQALFPGTAGAILCISVLPPRMNANDIFLINKICDNLQTKCANIKQGVLSPSTKPKLCLDFL